MAGSVTATSWSVLTVTPECLLKDLQALYSHIQKRPTTSLQSHDIIVMLADESYFDLVMEVVDEIVQLEALQISMDVFDGPKCVEFAKLRGYSNITEEWSEAYLGTAVGRKTFLYEACVDLQSTRLETKRRIRTQLAGFDAERAAAWTFNEEATDVVEAIEKALDIPVPPRPAVISQPPNASRIIDATQKVGYITFNGNPREIKCSIANAQSHPKMLIG